MKPLLGEVSGPSPLERGWGEVNSMAVRILSI
jgi:hypothetical protein